MRKSYCSTDGRRFPIGNAYSYTVKKGLFLSVHVDDIKLAGKKQNLDPMWKILNEEVELGEPTSFLDHVYLGCTQRQCEISKNTVDNYRTMFESRISRSKSGLTKSSILKTQENGEGSISSTSRIRNSKKPSRMRVRSWKHQWLLLCPVKL